MAISTENKRKLRNCLLGSKPEVDKAFDDKFCLGSSNVPKLSRYLRFELLKNLRFELLKNLRFELLKTKRKKFCSYFDVIAKLLSLEAI